MSPIVSLSKAAALLGIHRNTLAGWIEEGCPYITKADRSRGVEWKLSFPAVVEWRTKSVVAQAVAVAERAEGPLTLEGAQLRRAVAMAVTSEIEADQMLRSVLLREEAITDQKAFVAAVKRGVDSIIPEFARIASQLTNAPEIQDTFERMCNVGLATAKAELARLWGSPDAAGPTTAS